MKDPNDSATIDALDAPRRGRPKSGNALSNAEKQRRYRERKKAAGAENKGRTYTREEVQKAVQEYQDVITRLQNQLHLAEQERNAAMTDNRRLRDQLGL